MPKPKAMTMRERDYAKLKAWCAKRGVSMAETLGQLVKTLEVKKLESENPDMAICDECENEIPEDASFCPYCGVEFEEDEAEAEAEAEAEE